MAMATVTVSLVICLVGLNFFAGMLLFCFKAFGAVIEDTYGLSGVMTGLVVSFPEVGYLLSILPAAFLASRFQRPRIMALGCLLMSSGAVLFCLPRFLCSGDIASSEKLEDYADRYLCLPNTTNKMSLLGNISAHENQEPRSSQSKCAALNAPAWFLLGGLLAGIGAAPATTLHFSFIDDNLDRSKSPVYLGIIQAASLFGVLSSYFLAGALTKEGAGNKRDAFDGERHEVHWWLAFILASVGCVSLSFRLWCVRDECDGQTVVNRLTHSETESDGSASPDSVESRSLAFDESVSPGRKSEYVPTMSIKRLATDYWLLLAILAAAGWHFPPILNGTFILQYVHREFDMPMSTSSFMVGLVTGVPALVGIPLGGFLASRPSIKAKDLSDFLLMFAIIASFTIPIGCPSDENITDLAKGSGPGCKNFCGCDDAFIVCCDDGVTYASPCHAGCKGVGNSTSEIDFFDCECTGAESVTEGSCSAGICKKRCGVWKVGIFVFLLVMKLFLGCLSFVPYGVLLMRSVHPLDKALVVALKELSAKFVGDIIGCITIGRIFDSACLMRSKEERQSCSLYDLESLEKSYFLVNFLPLLGVVGIFCSTRSRLSKST